MKSTTAIVRVDTPHGPLWVEAEVTPRAPKGKAGRRTTGAGRHETGAARGAVGLDGAAVADASAVVPVPHPSDLVDVIKGLVSLVESALSDSRPTKTTVTAGLKLTGETGELAGWVIGKASGEATLTLTLEWDRAVGAALVS